MRCPNCHRRLAAFGGCSQHFVVAADSASSLPTSLPGQLVAQHLLGKGGAGQVFAVRDAHGELFALKLGEASMAARFSREADALRSLGPPHTPQLFGCGLHLGQPWLLMEKLEGICLATRMTEEVAPDECLSLARRIAQSLAVVHARGWCHRDLKPENLWLRVSGEIAVIDFGLTRQVGETPGRPLEVTLTLQSARMGTAHYMAPEQCVDAASAGRAADVYSLGVVLFELVTGRPPFVGDANALREAHVHRKPPALASLGIAWPSLEQILARSLAKEPAQRYAAIDQMLAALDAVRLDEVERQRVLAPVLGSVHSRQVALLGVASHANLDELLRPVRREGGLLVSTWQGRYIFAFPEPPTAQASVDAAQTAWHQLPLQAGDQAVLHVATVVVRSGATSIRVTGPEVTAPLWWNEGVPSDLGPHCTASAIGTAPRAAHAAPHARAVPFVGRVAVLEELTARLSRAPSERGRELIAVSGVAGIGKTRLLEQLVARVGPQRMVILDDADRFEPEFLREHPARHAVIAGRDLQLRPELVARRFRLEPLSEDESVKLLRELMHPLEFVAEELLRRLASLAHGVPGLLVELPEALRRSGALAPDPQTGEWRLASEAGLLSSTPLLEQLSQGALASLPRDYQDVARLCALLGAGSEDRLGVALRALPSDWSAASLDPRRALERLARTGVLRFDGNGYRFSERVLAEAIERSLSPLARRVLHHAAWSSLANLPTLTESQRAHRARHAEAAQLHAEAQRDFLLLAERAESERRDVDSETWLCAALLIPTGSPIDRTGWLWKRARARRRNQRFREARSDLQLALGQNVDPVLAVELWLEMATVADWNEDFEGSLTSLAQAEHHATGMLEQPLTSLRLELARGRAQLRRGEWEPAVARLGALAAKAQGIEPEVETVARLLAGSALAVLNRLDESEQQFQAAIARAQAAHDTLHLGVALSNRVGLWLKKDRLDNALDDLRASVALARAHGHPQTERWTSHNLAQSLVWLGQPEQALALAERAHTLGRRFFGDAIPPTATLLLARICHQLKDSQRTAELLAGLPATLAESDARQHRLLHLSLSSNTVESEWLEMCRADAALPPDEAIDLLLAAARRLSDTGHSTSASACFERARTLLPQGTAAVWAKAFSGFAL